jgi:hypothetical protein
MKRPALPEPDGVICRDDNKQFPGLIIHSDDRLFVEAWNMKPDGTAYTIDEVPVDRVAVVHREQKIKRGLRK